MKNPIDNLIDCPICDGTGNIEGKFTCGLCDGTGEITKDEYKLYYADKRADQIIDRDKNER